MSSKTLSIAILALGASMAHANLLTNGSFETATLPSKGWDLFNSIPGWIATTGHVEVGHGGIYGVSGYDGANVLELDADQNSVVAQSLNLGAGQYKISFDSAMRANTLSATNAFDVLWNGNVIASITPNSSAFSTTTETVSGVAGVNTLSFRATGANDSYGGMIDRVDVQAVPEPCSVAALGVGAAGLLRRRRKA